MRSNNNDKLQDEILKLKEKNRILLFQKYYLEQQLAESKTAREHCKLLDTETFWGTLRTHLEEIQHKK